MKRKYESPVIRIFVVAPQSGILTVGSIKGNAGLKLGRGGSSEARARESRLWTGDDNEDE